MEPLPHQYEVTVKGTAVGYTELNSTALTPIISAPPAEFGGPGNLWSPETLLVAAAADCFVLTFRAVAHASKLDWVSITCNGKGTVDRADGVIRFTAVQLQTELTVPAGGDVEKAQRTLEKAHKSCIAGNSLICRPTVEIRITVEQPAFAA
ncbi:MAG TPA: OsmC family protein [Terriglobia bacterium]|nr:OsmC family protein [Terriglobia bacterium]